MEERGSLLHVNTCLPEKVVSVLVPWGGGEDGGNSGPLPRPLALSRVGGYHCKQVDWLAGPVSLPCQHLAGHLGA